MPDVSTLLERGPWMRFEFAPDERTMSRAGGGANWRAVECPVGWTTRAVRRSHEEMSVEKPVVPPERHITFARRA